MNCQKKERRLKHIEFRNNILESQKIANYKNEFDRLQGAKKLSGLDTHAKTRMK